MFGEQPGHQFRFPEGIGPAIMIHSCIFRITHICTIFLQFFVKIAGKIYGNYKKETPKDAIKKSH
jgi:hypothetical protein